MSPNDVSRDDLIWLAGWLEGEGSFIARKTYGGSKTYPILTASSTDYDIIERVSYLLGAPSIGVHTKKYVMHKTAYRVAISGYNAINWMNKLYPFMGIRRKEQISEVLSKAWVKNTKYAPKITIIMAEEIRGVYRQNTYITQKELGKMFGISESSVGLIITNRIYVKGDGN